MSEESGDLVERLQSALFGVLHVMMKDASSSSKSTVTILYVIDLLQLLGFPLDPSVFPQFADTSITGGFAHVVVWFGLNPYLRSLNWSTYMTTFYCVVVFVSSLVFAALFVGWSFSIQRFHVLWPVKVLRVTSQLASTAFYIPLTGALLSIYKCEGGVHALSQGIKCWSGEHLIHSFVAAILIPLFFGTAFCFTAVFIDRNLTSKNLLARAHGRMDVVHLVVNTVLTAFFTLWNESWSQTLMAVVTLLSSLTVVVATFYYIPHYNNNVRIREKEKKK